MTEKEIQEATKRADRIVEKVRSLVTLEGKVVEVRESVRQLSVNGDTAPIERLDMLAELESQLKESVEELDGITDELKFATPCFRAYVLPQMSEIVGTLKACDAVDRGELAQLVTALTDENSQAPEQLEEAIITRLKSNLERTFSAA
ncbi:MAG: hypothetical protein OXU23_24750 [Candidatus Poribacteria bacterium]|nr:hypothetical protein [Candidatus Poribacteria bacterium]MDE0467739.1 hypothetical protein [Candidatus Poribacteria bacterium]